MHFLPPRPRISFRWLLNTDELLPAELASLRVYVLATCARILGAMSRIQLGYISNIFFRYLAERINPKKEVSAMGGRHRSPCWLGQAHR